MPLSFTLRGSILLVLSLAQYCDFDQSFEPFFSFRHSFTLVEQPVLDLLLRLFGKCLATASTLLEPQVQLKPHPVMQLMLAVACSLVLNLAII